MKILLKLLIGVVFIALGYAMYSEVQNNIDKELNIAFFGDSITEYGWTEQDGYVKLTVNELLKRGKKVIPIPAGVAGDTSSDLLSRIEDDVISKHPDVVVLMCGLNDIHFFPDEINTFKANMESITDKLIENNIKVVLLNITVYEGEFAELDSAIDEYNKVIKEIADNKKITLVDVRSDIKNFAGKTGTEDLILTVDGVHFNYDGNKILADALVPVLMKI